MVLFIGISIVSMGTFAEKKLDKAWVDAYETVRDGMETFK